MTPRRRRPFLRPASRLGPLVLASLALVSPATSASAGTDFRSTFDGDRTGSTPAPWPAFEYHGVFTDGYSISNQLQIVPDPNPSAGDHGNVARFVVNPGDEYGSSSGERALLRWLDDSGSAGSAEREGDDYYYGWSSLFPTTWSSPPGWGVVLEFHADSRFELAPIRIDTGGDRMSLDMTTGRCTDAYTCAYAQSHPFLTDLAKGRWNDFVLHVRWTKSADGAVQVWHRVAGGSWSQVLDLSGVPTLPWFAGQADPRIYLAWGLYTGAGSSTRVLYGDSFSRGTSFADVASVLATRTVTWAGSRYSSPAQLRAAVAREGLSWEALLEAHPQLASALGLRPVAYGRPFYTRQALTRWLDAFGLTYARWRARHPAAARVLESQPADTPTAVGP